MTYIKKLTAVSTTTILLFALFAVAVPVTTTNADPEKTGLVATFGPSIGSFNGNLQVLENANHLYSDVASSKARTVAFTNPASLPQGFFDAVQSRFQGGGAAPTPDTTITLLCSGLPLVPGFCATGDPVTTKPINVVKGYEEGKFKFKKLAEGEYLVTVVIFDMDDLGLIDMATGLAAPETVFVTANGEEIGSVTAVPGMGTTQTITKQFTTAVEDDDGKIKIGFNQLFTWASMSGQASGPILPVCDDSATPLPCKGAESGIRVEQITLTPIVDDDDEEDDEEDEDEEDNDD